MAINIDCFITRLNTSPLFCKNFFDDPIKVITKEGGEISLDEAKNLRDTIALTSKEIKNYINENNTVPRVCLIKTVSVLRPHYLAPESPREYVYEDPLLQQTVMLIDLGHLFWRQKLDSHRLTKIVCNASVPKSDQERIQLELDRQAINKLPRAKQVFSSTVEKMPDANDLVVAYRIISRCIAIASRGETNFEIHQSRGFLCYKNNQYSLEEVLKTAEKPLSSPIGQQLVNLIEFITFPQTIDVFVLNLRNDGEIIQIFLLASLLKAKFPRCPIILDVSGANEQFDFSQWVDPLINRLDETGKYIDYFLPRQDYKSTLRPLLDIIVSGFKPKTIGLRNLVSFVPDPPDNKSVSIKPINVDDAFDHYIRTSPLFFSSSQRTMLGRIAPARCYWNSCSFCTINSQHLLPSGQHKVDHRLLNHIDNLISVIRDKQIESLILMDEAVHSKVLVEFAHQIIKNKISIVYRVRSRFSKHFTKEICDLLYLSGCRYLGMGLESTSSRINELFNKNRNNSINYIEILDNLESSGIRAHIYAIMGFPTETREEIKATCDFLISCINRYRFVTVSANLFHLMRGSFVEQNPQNFAIENICDRNDVALVLDFYEPIHTKNKEFASHCAQYIYKTEFLPHVDDPTFAEAFWHFIDQTGIFYIQKVIFEKNPYHKLANSRFLARKKDFHKFRYSPSWLYTLDGIKDKFSNKMRLSDSFILCDWATDNYAILNESMRNVIFQYDSSVSLQENIERYVSYENRNDAYLIFRDLIDAGFFYSKDDFYTADLTEKFNLEAKKVSGTFL